MFKSMWWSHIPNIDAFPVISGSDNEPTGDPLPGGSSNPDSAGGAGGGQQQQQQGDPQVKIAALEEEKNRHWTAKEEAERKLQEASAELEELRTYKQTKDQESLTEEQKVQQKLADFEKQLAEKDVEIERLRDGARKLTLKNAFLAANDVQWHNPESALSLADLSEVEIVEDKDGVPSLKDPAAMKNAITALSQAHPYLVNNSEGTPTWQGKTGDKQQKQQVANDASKREKLLKNYPALRR
ncbi:scaffolding protein [Arthrobacter phage Wollypog]|uniref:Scaffolding protein n=1 Tax=Arthrobacter phage Wollypog TaxID=2790985 RepID=A0A7T3KC59_9CAUD|nr:scaffolding protein [Arthrobacter phage Wollypog]QPX62557.1 scaffolding protein [Arthrobacter phage Wollypog]